MSFINIAKDVLRPLRDVVSAGYGFLSDYARFYRYAGWRRMDRWSVRDYKAAKIYHRLEKSLSFRARRGQSGIGAARELRSEAHTTELQSRTRISDAVFCLH